MQNYSTDFIPSHNKHLRQIILDPSVHQINHLEHTIDYSIIVFLLVACILSHSSSLVAYTSRENLDGLSVSVYSIWLLDALTFSWLMSTVINFLGLPKTKKYHYSLPIFISFYQEAKLIYIIKLKYFLDFNSSAKCMK